LTQLFEEIIQVKL